MLINITVANKIASTVAAPVIVCGNSDYVVNFTFDEEWEEHSVKTARFSFIVGTARAYIDVVFTGTQCPVPVLSNIAEVKIGVYAGDLQTTTPAVVQCKKSILCGQGTPKEPEEDVYSQIMQTLEDNFPLSAGIKANDAADKALDAAEYVVVELNKTKAEIEAGGFIESLKELNKEAGIKFWIGTYEEYNAITPQQNVLYIFTDSEELQEIENLVADTARNTSEELVTPVQENVATMQKDIENINTEIAGIKTDLQNVANTVHTVLWTGSKSNANNDIYLTIEGIKDYSVISVSQTIGSTQNDVFLYRDGNTFRGSKMYLSGCDNDADNPVKLTIETFQASLSTTSSGVTDEISFIRSVDNMDYSNPMYNAYFALSYHHERVISDEGDYHLGGSRGTPAVTITKICGILKR